MFAQANVEPKRPELPAGGKYATWPNFQGKSSYTFTTKFEHEPYSVQYLRASDVQILRALYRPDDDGDPAVWTVQKVKDEIFATDDDVIFDKRWNNLVGFCLLYTSDAADE